MEDDSDLGGWRDLAEFATEHVGPVEVVDRPRVLGPTGLLRVRARDGRHWFVKRPTTRREWSAESSAYLAWARVPAVHPPVATCDRRRLLLLPAVRGERPGADGRVLLQAGRVLRDLHAATPPPEWRSDWREALTRSTDGRLAHLHAVGEAVDEGLVRDHLAVLLDHDGPEVATHGDYGTRNWLWHRRRLHVVDFGAAALRPAVVDLSRLRFRTCWDRPDDFQRLLRGYGRDLDTSEQRFLAALLPWRAVLTISRGRRRDQPRVAAHGRTVLDAVSRGDYGGRERLA